MEFWLVSSFNDRSAPLLKAAIEQLGHKLMAFDYREIWESWSEGNDVTKPKAGEAILIARQPYIANNVLENYTFLLKKLLGKVQWKAVLDRDLYRESYLLYEDKAYQYDLFKRLRLKTPKILSFHKLKPSDGSPVVVKKRLSSRGAGVYLMRNDIEFESFFKRENRYLYIFQEFVKLKHDLRILVLGGNVVGVMERKMIQKADGRLTVRSGGPYMGRMPEGMLKAALKVVKASGADLCGVDVGINERGEAIFMEMNPSPQFVGFERVMQTDVAGQIIEYLLTK